MIPVFNNLQLEEGPPTREIDSDNSSLRSIPESISSIKSRNPFNKIMKRFKKNDSDKKNDSE
jgi:hypothetical protein